MCCTGSEITKHVGGVMPDQTCQDDLLMRTVRDYAPCLALAHTRRTLHSLPAAVTHSVKQSKEVREYEGNNGKMRKPCGLCVCMLH